MDKRMWNRFAPIYNLFLRKDAFAYSKVVELIRKRVRGKDVLELATGTGLMAVKIADAARCMIATDFSEKMIAEARKERCPENLKFAVADACDLPYDNHSFDCVIISNALHIMPDPSRALSEARRILKPDGVLIAPTFVHGKMKWFQKLLSRFMSLFGFHAEHTWTQKEYLGFLWQEGWRIERSVIIKASFPICYAECVAVQDFNE